MGVMNNEEILAAVKDGDAHLLQPLLVAIKERYRNLSVDVAQQLAVSSEHENPFARGIITADRLPVAQPPSRLWFGLYPRSVILLIGETGAGKSSLIYNLVIHAARNEPLWGISFGLKRPVRVLYVDPENSGNFAEGHGGQCSVKVERINQGKPANLFFHDGQGVNLKNSRHIAALKGFIEKEGFDLVVLDPIANLFGTKDENDNAEAAEQMKALTLLSRQTGCCIIAVHHTGKNTFGDDGRGASARRAAADVAMMFRAKADADDVDDTYNGQLRQRTDQCRLQIVKNRLEGKGSLYLQMDGDDRFSLSSFKDWKGQRGVDTDGNSVPKAVQAEIEILALLADNQGHSRASIVAAMNRKEIGENATDTALSKLKQAKKITVEKQGRGGAQYYRLSDASFLLSQDPLVSEENKKVGSEHVIPKSGPGAEVQQRILDRLQLGDPLTPESLHRELCGEGLTAADVGEALEFLQRVGKIRPAFDAQNRPSYILVDIQKPV